MTFLSKGDPVPWFTAFSSSNPAYHFDSVGGYRIILSFLGHFSHSACARVLQDFAAQQPQLEQYEVPFCGVTIDPEDLVFERANRDSVFLQIKHVKLHRKVVFIRLRGSKK
ncbi:MAG: hypothetical protein ACKO7W_00465 [Elainella sp.]